MDDFCLLKIRRTTSGYVVHLEGRGTMRESPTLRDFASGALEDGADIWVDLSACEYLDSTFLGCLAVLQRCAKMGRGSFAVVADASTSKRLLAGVHLDRILDIQEDGPPVFGDAVALPTAAIERREFARHLIESHDRLAELGGPAAESFRRIAAQLQEEIDRSD